MYSALSTFGTPMDIIPAELSIELFFLVDESTEAALRRHAQRRHGTSPTRSTMAIRNRA